MERRPFRRAAARCCAARLLQLVCKGSYPSTLLCKVSPQNSLPRIFLEQPHRGTRPVQRTVTLVYPRRMDDQDIAVVKALVPVAWADGVFAAKEKEMLDALLDAYRASDKEKEMLHEYAEHRRSVDDIDLQELSADDRRTTRHLCTSPPFAVGAATTDAI